MRNPETSAVASQDGPADQSPDAAAADTSDGRVSFSSAETRADEMRGTIESWLGELAAAVDEARTSEAFRAWLDVQSRFHDYSYRNTLLIAAQRPNATCVAGYRTWQDEFDRHVRAGEDAIWIWAPVVARRCPECEHSPRYHDAAGCEYDGTPPEDWSKGVVAFKPVPVFDVAQTEGEPLPELETAAVGDGEALLDRLLDAADALGVAVRVVPRDEWPHGAAEGVCQWPDEADGGPSIEVRERAEAAAVAGTLVHELAHARLHAGVGSPAERSKREVEAEAVAYAVGRYFGLDTSNSAFYLAAWQGDESDVVHERLERVSATAESLIDAVDGCAAAG